MGRIGKSKFIARLKDAFSFSRTERNGIIILVGLIILTFILPRHFERLFPERIEYHHAEHIAEIDSFLASRKIEKEAHNPADGRKAIGEKSYRNRKEVKLHPENFNPNKVTREKLREIGFPEKVVSNLIKYREKGGRFRSRSDVKKIYGVTDDLYSSIKNYIVIPKSGSGLTSIGSIRLDNIEENDLEKQIDPNRIDNYDGSVVSNKSGYTGMSTGNNAQGPPREDKPKVPLKIKINSANEEEWMKLYGIGPAYSKRIVKFRDALGGFHSIDQIAEVYGLPDSTFQSIRINLVLDESSIRKININTATDSLLKQHPYLNWRTAKAVTNYRFQHGYFSGVDDLGKVKLLSDELLQNLVPYLSFDIPVSTVQEHE